MTDDFLGGKLRMKKLIGFCIYGITYFVFSLCLAFVVVCAFSGPFFVLVSGFMSYLAWVIMRYAEAVYLD